jgi:hypothetical protein
MGSSIGAVVFGVVMLVGAIIYGNLAAVFISLALILFAGPLLVIGIKRGWFEP